MRILFRCWSGFLFAFHAYAGFMQKWMPRLIFALVYLIAFVPYVPITRIKRARKVREAKISGAWQVQGLPSTTPLEVFDRMG